MEFLNFIIDENEDEEDKEEEDQATVKIGTSKAKPIFDINQAEP